MTEKTHTSLPRADASSRDALDRAKALVAERPHQASSPSWAHQASHVGDLSVLALALLAA